jgi:C4-type Zn-finger protein
VLLRREPRYEAVIRRDEYRLLRPDDLSYLVAQAKLGRIDRSELASEIRRKLEQDPWTHLRGVLERALAALEKNRDAAR